MFRWKLSAAAGLLLLVALVSLKPLLVRRFHHAARAERVERRAPDAGDAYGFDEPPRRKGPSDGPQRERPALRLPEGTRVERNLAYGPKGERNRLDLYLPAKSDKPLPLIVWVHGGGWQTGSKDAPVLTLPLFERGYAIASINYRLSDAAHFPAQIEDCKAAVRFLRANAKKYGLDPKRFGAWGASAGGHLVALLGTAGDVKDLEGDGPHAEVSSRVQAVCDWFGPTDLLKLVADDPLGGARDGGSAIDRLLGGPAAEKKALAQRASPLRYVTKDDPPFLIVHGEEDRLVPPEQSKLLHKALKAAGVDAKLVLVPGAAHGKGVATPEVVKEVGAFFDRYLKQPKSDK